MFSRLVCTTGTSRVLPGRPAEGEQEAGGVMMENILITAQLDILIFTQTGLQIIAAVISGSRMVFNFFNAGHLSFEAPFML